MTVTRVINLVQRNESTTELDSHADQCVIGSNALIVNEFDRPVHIRGFDPSSKVSHNLCTVSAALLYTRTDIGEDVILMIHQAIYVPTMEHNLLCPMQLRINDVNVNDKPLFLTDNLAELDHALLDPSEDDPSDKLLIPLSIRNVSSIFSTQKPTMQQYEQLPHFVLTSELPEYDPLDPTFSTQETSAQEHLQQLLSGFSTLLRTVVRKNKLST